MLNKKYFLIILLTFAVLTGLLKSNTSFASGACYCQGKIRTCVKPAEQGIVDAFLNMPIPEITDQTDCDKIFTTLSSSEHAADYNKCKFSPNLDCSNLICDQNKCSKVEQSCQSDSDCVFGLGYGVSQCINNFCYLDNLALQEYKKNEPLVGSATKFTLQTPKTEINLPGLAFSSPTSTLDSEGFIHLPWLAEYLSVLYKFALIASSIIAAIVIIIEGFKVVGSAGNGEIKSHAYERIIQVIIGLCIGWGSYTILYNINPDLVGFKILKIQYIQPEPLTEEDENIDEKDYPASQPANIATVTKPSWNKDSFDCSKKDSYTPAGVTPTNQVVTYTCGDSKTKITTIPQMKDPLCKVIKAANDAGYTIEVRSSYRDFAGQVKNWCGTCSTYTDTSKRVKFCAVPGYSNHGHGSAVDVVLKKGSAKLTPLGSKAQCNAEKIYVAKLAHFFYDTDPNFNRLETEIWHFEYGTGSQSSRGKFTSLPSVCK